MCGSMVDIQCPTVEIRRGKERKKKIEETTGLTPRLYDWTVSPEHLGFYF